MTPPPVLGPEGRPLEPASGGQTCGGVTRVLLMYITMFSGHYRASLAVERAVRQLEPRADILTIDAFQYFNPVLARLVDRTYMSVLHTAPGIWGYLYDHPTIARRSRAFQRWLHRYDAPKLREVLDEFQPTVIACTQAFPCGVAADYKQAVGLTTPLYAVLTDFIPHHYWVHPAVDGYLVGSEAARTWLERAGIPRARLHATGIPIDPVFAEASDGAPWRQRLGVDPHEPIVLVMGGGQGLGPIEEVVTALDALPQPFQLVVITGVNAKLYRRLTKAAPQLARRVVVLGHVHVVHELMSLASLIVTKPGGLTTAEALAKRLPMIIVDPIPGQEVKNTQFLLDHEAAVRAQRWDAVPGLVAELLADPKRLAALAAAAGTVGRPRSALDIARVLLSPHGARR